uniref:Uncharacterized protein n=1 Tax=Meloidogyne hapla TaxID=6305 RepID=A0A1I8BSN7_MELHA
MVGGCGTCTASDFICTDCSGHRCNHFYLKNSFKCYATVDDGLEEGELDFRKNIEQGCDYPEEPHSKICNEELCNDKEFALKNFHFCLNVEGKHWICPDDINDCHFIQGVNGKVAGCGKCPEGDFHCFDCNKKLCNTKENLVITFKCFMGEGKLTETKARQCDKGGCYLSFDFESIGHKQ